MKITKRHNDGSVSFSDLDIGDAFLFDNEVYLKFADSIDPRDDNIINAICLNDGCVSEFTSERVKKVQVELVIEV